MTGGPTTAAEHRSSDLADVAIQVARLDERTTALQRQVDDIKRTMATAVELRAWGALITLLLAALLAHAWGR